MPLHFWQGRISGYLLYRASSSAVSSLQSSMLVMDHCWSQRMDASSCSWRRRAAWWLGLPPGLHHHHHRRLGQSATRCLLDLHLRHFFTGSAVVVDVVSTWTSMAFCSEDDGFACLSRRFIHSSSRRTLLAMSASPAIPAWLARWGERGPSDKPPAAENRTGVTPFAITGGWEN